MRDARANMIFTGIKDWTMFCVYLSFRLLVVSDKRNMCTVKQGGGAAGEEVDLANALKILDKQRGERGLGISAFKRLILHNA